MIFNNVRGQNDSCSKYLNVLVTKVIPLFLPDCLPYVANQHHVALYSTVLYSFVQYSTVLYRMFSTPTLYVLTKVLLPSGTEVAQ